MKILIKYNDKKSQTIENDYIQTHCENQKIIIHGIDYEKSVEINKDQYNIEIIINCYKID